MSNAPAFTCRLYLRDEPYEPIDVRTISTSQITLGRDPSADWRLPDPDGAISRIHCTLRVLEDRLWLVDHSRNGTFLDTGERAPAGEPVEIASRQSFDVGALRILVDRACEGRTDETSALPAPGAGASSLPEDWSDGAPTAKRHRDASPKR
jgi:predicted component of type VI protein secretion system